MKNIKGKIINHNNSFNGEISFKRRIYDIKKINNKDFDNYIIPGFVDLHCHGGGGHDTMAGLSDIKKMWGDSSSSCKRPQVICCLFPLKFFLFW